ncbi:MAG: dihydrofolate reductase [Alphaproteobacteria bacterium]
MDKTPQIIISSIAAMARNRVIGTNNGMAWHIPEEFKYFKRTTMGKPIIMGRKSYGSLGKTLPGRPNIVISRSTQEPPLGPDGPFFVKTVDEAIRLAEEKACELNVDEIFITGGGQIYQDTLPVTRRLYLTVIDRDYEGDTYFPEFDRDEWKTVSEDKRDGDPPYTFFVLERK